MGQKQALLVILQAGQHGQHLALLLPLDLVLTQLAGLALLLHLVNLLQPGSQSTTQQYRTWQKARSSGTRAC
jgi:hypothetical protein